MIDFNAISIRIILSYAFATIGIVFIAYGIKGLIKKRKAPAPKRKENEAKK